MFMLSPLRLACILLGVAQASAQCIDDRALATGQREWQSTTADVLAKQEAELNATAHQSVDAKMARQQQQQQVLLLLLENDATTTSQPYYGNNNADHRRYRFRVGERTIDYPIIVATSPDTVARLIDEHRLVAAALFQHTDTTDWLAIQAEQEAELNATADQLAQGRASSKHLTETCYRQLGHGDHP
ncbi:hypothetical protein SYNPS1DRAFT_29774 [Syncephalis pseudoplumigaleata]|uniref:Uncharacterized protein n=1 Tax=Syncephalis pseudoplumigaleata TaxID=1712513 RepID=A0A4P9YZJ3_9FUNG|nr:hypothetical protein SYNPS1DRAFT_29774 [Syncephalis pseudoplumigaleata]|eukprot:RKP24460.1 hypothetical protein SYNPS1DRAFT_29774 [Syncephalis pseudoplumigaleata]